MSQRSVVTREAYRQLRAEEERIRRTNPLGLFCADCFSLCVLSVSGKRWNCPNGHDNEVIAEEATLSRLHTNAVPDSNVQDADADA